MKYCRLFLGIALAVLTVQLTGCGKNSGHNAPPLERNELVIRFFNSMKNGDYKAAVEQGVKLRTMDPYNDYLGSLIIIQQNNEYFRVIQQQLNSGRADLALASAETGVEKFPLNRSLTACRNMLRRLNRVPRQFRSMREAKTAHEMKSALTTASANLSGLATPEVNAYFSSYRAKMEDILRQEQEIMKRQERELIGKIALPPATLPAPLQTPGNADGKTAGASLSGVPGK